MAEALRIAEAPDPIAPHRELVAALCALGLRATVEYPGYVAVYAGRFCWAGDIEQPEACWRFAQQPQNLSSTLGELWFATGCAVADIATRVLREVRETVGDTVGTIVDAEPFEQNRTAEDALARLNRARTGSLVTPEGKPLGVAHLPYLRALRNHLFVFTDDVEREIARLEESRGGARG